MPEIEIQTDEIPIQLPKKRGRKPKETHEIKTQTKTSNYENVKKFREINGNYHESQKRAYINWRNKIKELTGSFPSKYNKIRLRDLKEKVII